MAGKAMVDFADWVKATNVRIITPPGEILNDAVKHTYVLADMLRGKGVDMVVQSGKKIEDRIQLVAGSQFSWYGANEQFTPVIEDGLTTIGAPWRFAKDAWAWTDHEIKLNGGGGDQKVQYKNLRDSKRQLCTVSMYNNLDAAMFATPNSSLMEDETTANGRPYSIRTFITDDGLAPAGFTTIQGVDPSTNPRWRNQVANYQLGAVDTTLVGAFDECWRKCKFEKPDSKEQYFTDTKFNKFRVYTSLDGWKLYVRLTRNANDRAVNSSGSPDLGYAVGDVTYAGIPVKYIEELDSAGWTTNQPRYYFCNYEYLFPVFHSERYLWETDPISGGHTQPYSYVVYKDIWMNLFCRSRWRQGVVVGA